MMKRFIFSFTVLISFTAAAQDKITLEDIWVNYAYYPKGVDEIRSTKDGKSFTMITQEGTIAKFDFATGNKLETIYTPSANLSYDSYEITDDESKILIPTESEKIYRHSSAANYLLYDVKTKSTSPVSKGKQTYPSFAPVGNKLAFIKENNIWIKDLSNGKETAVTSDGKKNEIINGLPDWVYEEEFTMFQAYQWSTDGSKIAYMKFNEKDVPSFTMPLYKGGLYPTNDVFKYPKVGEKNSIVSLWVYDVQAGTTSQVDLKNPFEYIPRFQWVDANRIAVFTMNRLQNELNINLCDIKTKTSSVILSEKSTTYIEISDDYRFLAADKGFIWLSEKDGFRHIYHYDYAGKLIRQVTKGNWDVTSLYGVDENVKTVFYQSAEVSPMDRNVYSITLDGKTKKNLTAKAGSNSANFSEGCKYFVNNWSDISTPPVFTVCDATGKTIRELEGNKEAQDKMNQLSIAKPEFFKFDNDEKVSLNGYMIKPKDFDANKKYPVFMYVYGGPGSQTTENKWGWFNYVWFQMLAQQGYIVVSVDNRGTGARGRDFRTSTYKQLGKVETDDQMSAAKWLGGQPYVDKSRIGIFGWSYGGYMSSLCITRGADLFKMAIAVAPVTNWKFYDNIYTERYMGTLQTNPTGYDDNAPIQFAKNLKGKYLLIHGTADDNVHWQNSAEMINALVKANKQFDQFTYPDRNHSIGGGTTRFHLYTMMTNYIKANL
jgi:dipeptidyl-peptidase-4